MSMIPENYIDKAIHAHMGSAIEAYARVEKIQVRLLAVMLKIDYRLAVIVFSSIQNVRSRNEMMQGLLSFIYFDKYRIFWASCSKFLNELASFRNAIVHWHPVTIIKVFSGDTSYGLKKAGARGERTLEVDDFPPFIDDCSYITGEIEEFMQMLRGDAGPPTWPDKFQQGLARQNQARLQPSPTPKAP